MKRIAMLVMLATVSVTGAGCVAVAIGAVAVGTVVYVHGEVRAYFDSDVQTLYDATLKAMGDLKVLIVEQKHDALSAVVVARNSMDQKITVQIDGSDRAAVKVSIRIGFRGDEAQERLVLDRIKTNMK
jgi:hypothetical protein